MFIRQLIPSVVLLLALSSPAHAYIGPGLGAGTLAVVLGILGSIFMAFFAVLWYPIKRMRKKKQAARAKQANPGE
ncbi:hypothetical protein CDO87_26275 (plasmid) [Sagittula sp. P11]|uniref:hypothetical protein n=1 Tax=unclassified Sagittula TaxID=2624628 RepID=UPI000C2D155F|nr:hypothetical protein [Sagittula sp. P11]AUC56782.1 hypothetical protein CDO87_26275 [Sagittula sp. P11]